jgi:hypothetical protein
MMSILVAEEQESTQATSVLPAGECESLVHGKQLSVLAVFLYVPA